MKIFKYLADTLENLIRIIAHSIWVICVVTPSYFILLLIKWALDQFGQFFEEWGISPTLRTIFFTVCDPKNSRPVLWFIDYTKSFFSKIWRKNLFLFFFCILFCVLVECTLGYFIDKFGFLTFFFVIAIFFCIGFQHDCRVCIGVQQKANKDKMSWYWSCITLYFLPPATDKKTYFSELRGLWVSSRFLLFSVYLCLFAIGLILIINLTLFVLSVYLRAYPFVFYTYIFYMFWYDILANKAYSGRLVSRYAVYVAFMVIVLKFITFLIIIFSYMLPNVY